MIDFVPLPVYDIGKAVIPVVPICANCKHWQAEADGEAGECKSPLFADAVWARWEFGSPILTIPSFVCGYFEDRE